MELVIYLKNEEDLAVLEPLLKRMQLRFERKNTGNAATTEAEQKLKAARTQLLQMLREGVDVSTYGDPMEWQRETRADDALPFRD